MSGQGRVAALVGAESLRPPRTGIGRMTAELARALMAHPEVAGIALLDGGQVLPPEALDLPASAPGAASQGAAPGGTVSVAGRLRARLAALGPLRRLSSLRMARRVEAAAAALARRTGAPVLYHEPNLVARPFSGGPCVVTVNDLSWRWDPSSHPAERIAWIERNLDRTLAQATRLVAISAFTAGEAVRHLGVDPARVDVVPLAASAGFAPVPAEAAAPVLARHGLEDCGYLLSVATLEPRKNLPRLVRAHARLPVALRRRVPLVLAGGEGWGQERPEWAEIARAREAGELRLLGYVPDADLPALYARCAAFAYVSLYEGFGLPVVEAMACGAAVVASDASSIPEVAGGAALLVDPRDEAAMAEALRRVLEDAGTAEALRAAAVPQAARFSWERTAAGVVASWRRALGEGA